MFDIGFSELLLILVVALVVVGPERLPRLARTAGMYIGRMRRMVASVQADVQRELAAEDLKRTLQQQAESAGLHEIIEEGQQAATAAEQLMKPEAEAAPKPAATHAASALDSAATADSKHGGD